MLLTGANSILVGDEVREGLEQGQKLFFRNFFAHLVYFNHCVKQVHLLF